MGVEAFNTRLHTTHTPSSTPSSSASSISAKALRALLVTGILISPSCSPSGDSELQNHTSVSSQNADKPKNPSLDELIQRATPLLNAPFQLGEHIVILCSDGTISVDGKQYLCTEVHVGEKVYDAEKFLSSSGPGTVMADESGLSFSQGMGTTGSISKEHFEEVITTLGTNESTSSVYVEAQCSATMAWIQITEGQDCTFRFEWNNMPTPSPEILAQADVPSVESNIVQSERIGIAGFVRKYFAEAKTKRGLDD